MIRKKLVLLTVALMLVVSQIASCNLPPPILTRDEANSLPSPTRLPATKARSSSSIQANEMQWETNGGGQVTFNVRRDGSDFNVQVTEYGFGDRNDRFTITPDAGEVHLALLRMMQDQSRIRTHVPLPGETTGTWTTLQFSDGEHVRTVEDVMAWSEGDAKIVYDYVTAQIEAGAE